MTTLTPAIVNKWAEYRDNRDHGLTVELSAAKAGLSPSSAYRYERGEEKSQGVRAALQSGVTPPQWDDESVAVPKPDSRVANDKFEPSPEALNSLDDFEMFRMRYFGRKSQPWQVKAAFQVAKMLSTREREYVVMNEPPGSGKSTLFTHDVVCWMIARDRSIRIQIGSRTERQARMYVSRVKRSLERDAPMRASADDKEQGIASDATNTLAEDFSAFKPDGRSDMWRGEGLVVQQLDGVALDDKEPTVSAWGMDSGFLGGRFDLIIWDDLVDAKNTKSEEARNNLKDLYFTEMETRLEPGGLLLLQGQRIAPEDLYRTALDQRRYDEQPKYTHVVYQAHDEGKCKGVHSKKARAWPYGCLLDPYRLPWRTLETVRTNNPRTFALMYQQEDGAGTGGLIERAWLEGGVDTYGDQTVGCFDNNRVIRQLPVADTTKLWSFITVDPSPTEYWGVLRWLYDDDTQRWYLMDIRRLRLRPDDWLAYDMGANTFTGELVKMMDNAEGEGFPVTDVMVEINAAQRWLLSQPHVQLFQKRTKVRFIQHTTNRNKLDPLFGVETIAGPFKDGRIRIPWGDAATRIEFKPLIDELLRYPDSTTTDLVMSTWFSVLAVNNHFPGNRQGVLKKQAPALYAAVRRGIA